MASFERGVYEPRNEPKATDGLRVFDGSEEEEDVEGSRLPLLIVLALLVLAMFAGVVWLAYTQGVARGRGETPVLTAANGPERVAPQDAGGNTVPYQGFKIYEQPAPPDDSAEAAPPVAAPKPAPAPVAPPPAVAKVEPPPVAKPAPAKIEPAPAKPQPAPAKTEAPPKSVAALIQQANSEPPKPAPAVKAAPPVAKPAVPAPSAQATGAPRSLAPPQQMAAAAPTPLKPATPATAGGYVLQIGAFKSRAEADAAWKTYQARHSALLSGYSNNVQQVDLGEKGTWYRLRIGGLANKEVATALCDRLKADGGACIPGR